MKIEKDGVPDVLNNPLHAVPDPLAGGGRAGLDLPHTVLEIDLVYHVTYIRNGGILRSIIYFLQKGTRWF